ncbi:MAG: hypothetical protein E6G01_01530 [Actinobacteria bacterium]|nr:MAG: hypothetical protein E6G01_01530 [Actinomycetota bacterium]
MSYRRRQWGCGTVLVLILLLGLSIEFWYVTLPVLALLVVGAIAAEASKERQRQGTVSRPALPPHVEAERQALLRRIDALSVRRYRSRCDNCGAPRRYRADSCRYCGRSLVAG